MRTKQVIVIRRDLKMRRGKEITQGAHASSLWLIHRARNWITTDVSFTEAQKDWMDNSYRKITVTVNSEDHLKQLHASARMRGIEAHLVTDLGLTEFNGVPTLTALAIGPDTDENVSLITDGLPLY